ncbi:MAG: T9SS type A sorting domain-containing protein [Cytophagaceae bacterium]|nr:T9SS type A sorting domain-containing protein [Cytophagaceae bacterium]
MRFILLFTVFLISSYIYSAGNYPFPQNVTYVYGIKPTNAKYQDALSSYNSWKYSYLVDVNVSMKRVLFQDGSSTVSEGIAYGLLLAAYANDQATFNGLWNYYKAYMNSRGVMNWKINANGTIASDGYNGATDAEEDAAMGLIIADKQWGSAGTINYLADAITLINNIMAYEVEKPSYTLKPGDVWGGNSITNPSYFAPAYYRIFKMVTGDAQWDNVITRSYQIIAANAHPTTGLVSDWCNGSGGNAGISYNYTYDATRLPWRIATDYLWFGTAQAKSICTKMANFVKNTVGGTIKVVDGYTRSGTKLGNSHNNTFVGTFALTAMVDASFQDHLNASYTDNVRTQPDGYFSQMLHTISLFMLTGNFYRLPPPVCQSPNLGADLSLCVSSSYTLDPGVNTTNRNYLWSTGETTPTISVNKLGTYTVRIDSAGCLKHDTIRLLGLDVNLGEDQIIGVDEVITLDAVAAGGGTTYLWNTSENSQTITTDTAGLFWVQVDSSGCTDRDTINISYKETKEIVIYPNPNTGRFSILLLDATAAKAEVSIYSLRGQFIGTIPYAIETGDPIEIDLSGLTKGLYIIKVETGSSVRIKKILIY